METLQTKHQEKMESIAAGAIKGSKKPNSTIKAILYIKKQLQCYFFKV